MASQADYFKVKKKVEAPTAAQRDRASGSQGYGEMAREAEREASKQATGAANLQASEASKGAYAGLGLAERARAERMVRNGEAKTRDEAAAKIRGEKKPKASAQAGALEK